MGTWGGTSQHDGQDGVPHMGANQSNVPVEMIEADYPLRIEHYGFVADTAGPGGSAAASLMREFRVLADEAMLSCAPTSALPAPRAVRRRHRRAGWNIVNPGGAADAAGDDDRARDAEAGRRLSPPHGRRRRLRRSARARRGTRARGCPRRTRDRGPGARGLRRRDRWDGRRAALDAGDGGAARDKTELMRVTRSASASPTWRCLFASPQRRHPRKRPRRAVAAILACMPSTGSPATTSAAAPRPGLRWADLLRRVYDIDMRTCPNCGLGPSSRSPPSTTPTPSPASSPPSACAPAHRRPEAGPIAARAPGPALASHRRHFGCPPAPPGG